MEEIEKTKKHNKKKVLRMLQESDSVSNKEFTKAQIGRFGGAIKELRMDGYIISKTWLPNSDGTVVYTLVGKGEPIEKVSALEKLQSTLINMGYENLASNFKEVLDESQVTVRNKPVY